jgi:hypothetical protein
MEQAMRFFLQMGYGMMAMNRELLARFDAGQDLGVIMCPRAMNRGQEERHAREVLSAGATLLYDSCFYSPRTDRSEILEYPYWVGVDYDTTDFAATQGAEFCKRVIDYQVGVLDVTEILLPGSYTNTVTDEWLEIQHTFAQAADDLGVDRPVYTTLALGPDVILNQAALNSVIDDVVTYPVSGIYLVYRPCKDEFLPTNSLFLVNLLSAFLSLTLADKDITLGYANQADLVFAAAGVRTIASGNYRNVRCFDPTIFEVPTESIPSRKVWYYDGQTMGEYLPEQLGIAYQRFDMKGMFGPSTPYVEALLDAPNPAVVNLLEPDAFKHFLTALRDQWLRFRGLSPIQRLTAVENVYQEVDRNIGRFNAKRFALGRSFADSLSAIEDALTTYKALEAERLQML